MYDVEAKVPYQKRYPDFELGSEWKDVFNVPQLESDSDEYQRATDLARDFREFYQFVRVVKVNPGGLREIVRECPFSFAHTREWCGYSECREG